MYPPFPSLPSHPPLVERVAICLPQQVAGGLNQGGVAPGRLGAARDEAAVPQAVGWVPCSSWDELGWVPGGLQHAGSMAGRLPLKESKEAKGKDADPIMNLEDTDFWTDAIKPNGNFYITDESINYVFNPYEIAPYYMGQTEVTIPFARIRNILKPNSIVQYLVDKQLNSNK